MYYIAFFIDYRPLFIEKLNSFIKNNFSDAWICSLNDNNRIFMLEEKDLDIKITVLSLLREILDCPERDLQLSYRLIEDLKIDSDVLSFEFAIPLMQQLGINVPDMAWLDVYTIEDTINILKKYRN